MSVLARSIGLVTFSFPARTARRLHAFARAEQASHVDLRLAARLTPSAARAALYLRHAADEERHARMFASHAREWSERAAIAPPTRVTADVEHLFARLGEVGFLAFVHRGEARGRRQFEAYRDHFARRGEPRTARLFEVIVEDERRHEAYTRELLDLLSGSEGATRRELAQALAWEALRTWRRAGRTIADALHSVSVGLLYLSLAPLALAIRLAMPVRTVAPAPPLTLPPAPLDDARDGT